MWAIRQCNYHENEKTFDTGLRVMGSQAITRTLAELSAPVLTIIDEDTLAIDSKAGEFRALVYAKRWEEEETA